MALILPQNQTRASLKKMTNGRLLYSIVDTNQVVIQQGLGWTLANIDMTRQYNNRKKFLFKRVLIN